MTPLDRRLCSKRVSYSVAASEIARSCPKSHDRVRNCTAVSEIARLCPKLHGRVRNRTVVSEIARPCPKSHGRVRNRSSVDVASSGAARADKCAGQRQMCDTENKRFVESVIFFKCFWKLLWSICRHIFVGASIIKQIHIFDRLFQCSVLLEPIFYSENSTEFFSRQKCGRKWEFSAKKV
jgi:hypothetical protein